MNVVGKFEKVSKEQFIDDFERLFPDSNKVTREAVYKRVMLPERSTSGSAGYDFYTPIPISILPGESVIVPTGIRAKINDGWYLAVFPRSSLGFKYRMQLDNSTAVIDSDYYNADNEGHIMIKITNDSKEKNKNMFLEPGDRFVQGIFMPYGVVEGDETDGERTGGIGSTGE